MYVKLNDIQRAGEANNRGNSAAAQPPVESFNRLLVRTSSWSAINQLVKRCMDDPGCNGWWAASQQQQV